MEQAAAKWWFHLYSLCKAHSDSEGVVKNLIVNRILFYIPGCITCKRANSGHSISDQQPIQRTVSISPEVDVHNLLGVHRRSIVFNYI